MNPLLGQNLRAIQALCKKHGVSSLHAFGSALRDDFAPVSDVDLLVEFGEDPPANAFLRYFELKEGLEGILGRPVDLVTGKSLANPFFMRELDRTRMLLYAA